MKLPHPGVDRTFSKIERLLKHSCGVFGFVFRSQMMNLNWFSCFWAKALTKRLLRHSVRTLHEVFCFQILTCRSSRSENIFATKLLIISFFASSKFPNPKCYKVSCALEMILIETIHKQNLIWAVFTILRCGVQKPTKRQQARSHAADLHLVRPFLIVFN